jgi:hypothetical protein
VKAWCRSLGITVAAVLIVATIIGTVLYSMSNHDNRTGLALRSVERPGSNSERVAGGGPRGLARQGAGAIKPKSRKTRSSPAAGSTATRRNLADLAPQRKDGKGRGRKETIEGEEKSELTSATTRGHTEPLTDGGLGNRAHAQELSKPTAGADGKVAERGPAERKRLEASWRRKLTDLHKGFHVSRGSDSAKLNARNKAESEVDAIDDPMAVPAIWGVLSGKAEHHQLVARTLGRITSAAGTKMLAALSVYSQDEKARRLATNALRTRDPNEFVEPLISVLNSHMRWRPEWIDIPGRGRAQVLFIEGERVDYQFLYPSPEGPGPPRPNVYSLENPYMNRQERQMAEEFNRAQSAMARAATDAQLKADIEEVKRLNQLVDVMNERAVGVLREATGKYLMPDREQWKRWLAERRGYPYVPPQDAPKPTIAQVVPPLYSPTFISVPAAT